MPSNDPQFGNPINPAGILAGVGSGASAGAALGSVIPGLGTLAGGIGGAVVGGVGDLIGDLTGPSASDIYNSLMQDFYNSPEYKQEQDAMTQLKGQTVQGPTATEKANLTTALNTVNQQFGSQYGAIQQGVAARAGVGGSTEAALLASQGQGQATGMSNAAMQAAAAEEQRREQATQAYTTATQQAANMQNQYREWASGQAQQRQNVGQAAAQSNITDMMKGIGSTAAVIGGEPKTGGSPTVMNPTGSNPMGLDLSGLSLTNPNPGYNPSAGGFAAPQATPSSNLFQAPDDSNFTSAPGTGGKPIIPGSSYKSYSAYGSSPTAGTW